MVELNIAFDDLNGTDVGNALLTLNINDFNGSSIIGDVNQDDVINFFDISPFISVLSNSEYQFEADSDGNGVVDFFDIQPFIGLLSAGP